MGKELSFPPVKVSSFVFLVRHTQSANVNFYTLGACGNYATSQDHITALSVSQFSGGQPCGRKILVTNQDNQKSVQVFVQGQSHLLCRLQYEICF